MFGRVLSVLQVVATAALFARICKVKLVLAGRWWEAASKIGDCGTGIQLVRDMTC